MSAFIVGRETMDAAVSAIIHKTHYGHVLRTFAGFDTSDRDNWTKIGRALYALNIKAVAGRYGEDDLRELPGPVDQSGIGERYRFRLDARRSWVTGYKALECLHYQCSEEAAVGDPLYGELEQAMGAIAKRIVAGLPEYEAVPWG